VFKLLLDIERSLPLDLDDYPQVISCLLERFSREQDSVNRAKIACLLGQLGKAPGLKVVDLANDIMRMLKTESMTTVEFIFYFVIDIKPCLQKNCASVIL